MKSDTSIIQSTRPYTAMAERIELLPFRVHLVKSAQDLAKAVEIRSSAYSRHLPHLADALRTAESEDHRSDVLLLIAERKIDQRPIGSMRLQPNFDRPLRIEGEFELPVAYRGRRLVETTRLGVENGSSSELVTAALIKAAFEICHACDIDFGIAGGRRSMAKVFRAMCYDELGGPVPISYGNNVLHWIFAIPILDVERRLSVAGHALHDFMARTEHPDIRVDYERVFAAFGRC